MADQESTNSPKNRWISDRDAAELTALADALSEVADELRQCVGVTALDDRWVFEDGAIAADRVMKECAKEAERLSWVLSDATDKADEEAGDE